VAKFANLTPPSSLEIIVAATRGSPQRGRPSFRISTRFGGGGRHGTSWRLCQGITLWHPNWIPTAFDRTKRNDNTQNQLES